MLPQQASLMSSLLISSLPTRPVAHNLLLVTGSILPSYTVPLTDENMPGLIRFLVRIWSISDWVSTEETAEIYLAQARSASYWQASSPDWSLTRLRKARSKLPLPQLKENMEESTLCSIHMRLRVHYLGSIMTALFIFHFARVKHLFGRTFGMRQT